MGAALYGGRLIQSGPNWWQSLAARPYLALAERGLDMGDPGFWILPIVAPLAGAAWAYGITRSVAAPTLRPTVLVALTFGGLVLFERETPWLLAPFVRPEDGHERAHLLLGLVESVFVVAAGSTAALTLGLGLGRRAIGIATPVGAAAMLATAITFVVLDLLGVRVGSGEAAMVKTSIISAAVGAAAGGAALGVSLHRSPRVTSGQPR